MKEKSHIKECVCCSCTQINLHLLKNAKTDYSKNYIYLKILKQSKETYEELNGNCTTQICSPFNI